MKKYRLKQTYPGSPEKGFVYNYTGNLCDDSNNYNLSNPENYPNFWEEVIEKDYEILTLQIPYSYTASVQQDGKYSCTNSIKLLKNGHCNLEQMFDLGYIITSIKRLSDGKIFTIGDKVSYNKTSNKKFGTFYIIQEFQINKNSIVTNFTTKSNTLYLTSDTKWNKLKTPLFTTEDNISIFEGDTVYSIDEDYCLDTYHNVHEYLDFSAWKIFSTKEKAEEYILMNKPCLNIEDIRKLNKTMGTSESGDYLLLKNLKDLVKTKLK